MPLTLKANSGGNNIVKALKAARITWADVQIDQQMKLLTAPLERPKKAGKRAKNK